MPWRQCCAWALASLLAAGLPFGFALPGGVPLAQAQTGVGAASPTAEPPHHDGERFRNPHLETEPKGLPDFIRWRWDAARQALPPPPSGPTPVQAPNLSFIQANAGAGGKMEPAVTWVGHATVLVQVAGFNLLTDPMFSERASPVDFAGPRRQQPPGIELRDLPRIDIVLLSHNHYDHCDVDSLRRLNRQVGGPPLFIVPLGLKAWMAGLQISNVIELDWWQSHRTAQLEVIFTPTQHGSGRGLMDRNRTLWGGFAVIAPDLHLFFAGDTGYSKDFAEISRRLADRQKDGGFDLALLPIGAYEPRWFMAEQHVDPVEALRIHIDLRAKRSMGIHWGTFELSDEALDKPPADLALARRTMGLPQDEFFVLAIGQTRKLPRRDAAQ
jgi:N-acyl-phosphatidylethanolamine-hydrolysing phospholipase D